MCSVSLYMCIQFQRFKTKKRNHCKTRNLHSRVIYVTLCLTVGPLPLCISFLLLWLIRRGGRPRWGTSLYSGRCLCRFMWQRCHHLTLWGKTTKRCFLVQGSYKCEVLKNSIQRKLHELKRGINSLMTLFLQLEMLSVPVFRLAAWGWLTGCWPSPGWEEASDWVGARKGTNECHGKTGTDRGSTLVHTAEKNRTA